MESRPAVGPPAFYETYAHVLETTLCDLTRSGYDDSWRRG